MEDTGPTVEGMTTIGEAAVGLVEMRGMADEGSRIGLAEIGTGMIGLEKLAGMIIVMGKIGSTGSDLGVRAGIGIDTMIDLETATNTGRGMGGIISPANRGEIGMEMERGKSGRGRRAVETGMAGIGETGTEIEIGTVGGIERETGTGGDDARWPCEIAHAYCCSRMRGLVLLHPRSALCQIITCDLVRRT